MTRKKNINTRSLVIENTVIIEEQISYTLGVLLDIDWKKSKSFGYYSTALSFNQKVQIIQDLQNIDKDLIVKLNYLMSIRNKFAHVREISSFNDYYKVAKNGNEIKRKLIQWYLVDFKDELQEEQSIICLFQLVRDINKNLRKIVKKISYERGFNVGEQEATDDILNTLITEIKKDKNGQAIINRVVELVEMKTKSETNQPKS